MTLFFLRLFSRLPFGVLHAISGLVARLASEVLGYRRPVIRGNIERSFPERSRRNTGRLNACITGISRTSRWSPSRTSRFPMRKPDRAWGMSMLKSLSHFFRPVGVCSSPGAFQQLGALCHDRQSKRAARRHGGVQAPVQQNHGRSRRESRQRFGLEMVRTVDSQAWMDAHVQGERPKAVVMGFDQSPADPVKSWWNTFLHQETAWYFGLEKWARMYDLPVIYGHIKKVKRGRYETHYELVTDSPNALPEGAILQRCIDLLEADIRETPHQWLWSHKRWKHARPESMPLNSRPETEIQPAVDHA